jgi:methyltransferase
MELNTSLAWFIALVMSVAALGLVELGISNRRRAALIARGATSVREPQFRSMVALHSAILLACIIEAWLRARSPALVVSIAMLAALVFANLLRLWVIASLGEHWNVQIMASLPLGVVTRGPFRWIRHPTWLISIASSWQTRWWSTQAYRRARDDRRHRVRRRRCGILARDFDRARGPVGGDLRTASFSTRKDLCQGALSCWRRRAAADGLLRVYRRSV